MNEELKNENPVNELEQRLMELPSVDPNTTVTVMSPEEESGSVLPVVLGIGAVVTAGVAGTVAWFKHRKKKLNKIAELDAELARLKDELEAQLYENGSEFYPEEVLRKQKTE